MSTLRRLLVVAIAILGLGASSAVAAQHLNAYSLEGQFICVSCHEPLNQVNSPESQAEKQDLARYVKQGLTLAQIKAQMVDTYGESVLAKPPAHGLNLLVYILPPLVLLGGLAFVFYSLPRWRNRARAEALMEPHDASELDPEDQARLNEELSRFDS